MDTSNLIQGFNKPPCLYFKHMPIISQMQIKYWQYRDNRNSSFLSNNQFFTNVRHAPHTDAEIFVIIVKGLINVTGTCTVMKQLMFKYSWWKLVNISMRAVSTHLLQVTSQHLYGRQHTQSLWDPHLSPAGAPLSTLSAESTASEDVSTCPTSSSAVVTAAGVQCCVCRGGGVGFTGRAGFGGRAGLPTPCRLSCKPSGVPTGVEVLCGGDNSPLSSRRIPYSNR
jgi:hypothetical protein